MATPTFCMPLFRPKELIAGLEEEARRQQEATPSPNFRSQPGAQAYDYLCEIEHNRFTTDEVENFRMRIVEPSYWEREARHLKDKLSELVLQKLLREYGIDSAPTDSWRNVAMAYGRRLKRHGYSTQQVRESRLEIKDQGYWKPEAECLRRISALREHEMHEKYLERRLNIERETHGYPDQKPRRQTPSKQPTRRSQRLQPNIGQPGADRVSDKRRSGLRSSTRVERRSGRLGVKAR